MQVVNGTGAVGGEFTLVSGSDTSAPLAFNASAAEVADAVNTMRSWEGLVLVDRQELLSGEGSDSVDAYEGDLFEWRLTFPPAEGDVEELRVRTASSFLVLPHVKDFPYTHVCVSPSTLEKDPEGLFFFPSLFLSTTPVSVPTPIADILTVKSSSRGCN